MPVVDPRNRGENDAGHRADTTAGQPERWRRVKALFIEALQYSESERREFLARTALAEPELISEVESLLDSDAAAAELWETPAAALLLEQAPDDDTKGRLAVGTQLGAYEITSFIAAGGMGAVYRARHRVLGREVALKTVGKSTTDPEAKRRLIREARHASLLTHRNICAIFDVGDENGLPFIVMEYVEGESLGAVIRRAVPRPSEALQYAVDIAAALEHAHQRGIIHRDLKSSNVVIDREQRAVVLDFGVARRLPPSDEPQGRETTVTKPFELAGTLSHMAPEVLCGQRADARSDIWAFGVLLHELLTGELPFTGRTQFEVSSAIINDPPKTIDGPIPLGLRLIVERCLVKDPAGRYQSAESVRRALEAVRRRAAWPLLGSLLVYTHGRARYRAALGAVAVLGLVIAAVVGRKVIVARGLHRISTLAVLASPLETTDPGGAYYADGVTDALIAQLGSASDVHVFSRASAERFARRVRTPAEVGTRLGADLILLVRVRPPNADTIAIEASLVDSHDGHVVWSRAYQRHAREVLAVEAAIVGAVTTTVRGTLRPAIQERLAVARAISPEVYEAYLKGKYEWNRRTPSSIQLAIRHFQDAVDLDPTYAPAHAALADCYNQLGTVLLGSGSPRDYRPRAAAEAIKALQIEPASAEAHAALGYVWHYDLRWIDAEREFRRAIELNPSYALAHIWYANLLMSRSRMADAIREAYTARELDPFSLVVNTNVGWVLHYARRDDDAITQLRWTLTLDSTYAQARSRLIAALDASGRHAEAHAEAHRLVAQTDSAVPWLAALAISEAHDGQADSARALLSTVLRRTRQKEYVPSVLIAHTLASLGDVDSAMTWMETAFGEGSNAIAYLAVEPNNAPMRANPRFRRLLARAGLP
jgi:eukaryotic-like serine/threonine-protein kinase